MNIYNFSSGRHKFVVCAQQHKHIFFFVLQMCAMYMCVCVVHSEHAFFLFVVSCCVCVWVCLGFTFFYTRQQTAESLLSLHCGVIIFVSAKNLCYKFFCCCIVASVSCCFFFRFRREANRNTCTLIYILRMSGVGRMCTFFLLASARALTIRIK